MKALLQPLAVGLLFLFASGLSAQYEPPAAKLLEEAVQKAIAARTEKLATALASLRRQNVRDPGLADAEIYHKAAVWIVAHGEFYQPNFADWTLETLDRGLVRASQLAQGEAPWLTATGQTVVRAYRSHVDGSVQPYAVTYPAGYARDRQKWRLDIVLHGRDSSITEVKFLHQHGDGKAAPKDQDFVRIDIYGRGNNAYRWAGETDVIEVIQNFLLVEQALGRERFLDPYRVVLRGFSMGGAGTWHLGLHHPDRWCVMGPGAGFTSTHGYIKGLPEKLPAYQEACLRIYDAVDYAENAFDVPIVAYSGGDDPQKLAADNIEARLKQAGLPMTHLIAPGLGHNFPAEWQKKAEAEYSKYAGPGKGRAEYPPKVKYVTYTLRYPSCAWVEMVALDRHYEKAIVDAERLDNGFTVKTANVRALRLTLPDAAVLPQTVKIDGQELIVRPHRNAQGIVSVYVERNGGQWQGVLPQKVYTGQLRRPQKTAGHQGPIDDAFMDGFLCVRGTGKPWNEAMHKHAEAELERFSKEWHLYMRGEMPIKDDGDVTDDDFANRHLILFGDPSSNSLIGQALDGLPLRWTKESIALGGKTYPSASHLPVLIYPNPLAAGRYIVLNSGHTFHAAEFRGTNALLYPRLGDYAILKPAPTSKDPLAADVITAGLFDEFWQVK